MISALLLLSAVLLPTVWAGESASTALQLPWWLLAMLFAVFHLNVLYVERGREAQTLSLTEIPMLLGLFFADARSLLLANLLSGIVAFGLVRRQTPARLLFNLALLVADVCVAWTVFTALHTGAVTVTATAWLGSYSALFAAGLLDVVAVAGVMAAVEGRLDRRELLRDLAKETVPSAMATTVALVAVYALTLSVAAALPLAGLLVIVLLNQRAHGRLRQRHLSLERLYRFSQVVSRAGEGDEVVPSILAQAKQMLRADSAALTLLAAPPAGGAARAVLTAGDRLERSALVDLELPDWLLDRLVTEPHPVALHARNTELRVQDFLRSHGCTEALVAPLRSEEGFIGILLVADRIGHVRGFDDSDVPLLETIANHAGVALHSSRLTDQLRHEALHDALTGLPNRILLHRDLTRAVEQIRRGELTGCAVGMMDLDGFREINDALGHQRGDELLQEVAARLTRALGGVCCARLGGDEFAFLLTAPTALVEAPSLARHLLEVLEQPIDLHGLRVEVRASLGLAYAPEHAQDAVSLLKRAELAMYDAKSSGSGIRTFESRLDTLSPTRLGLVAELRQALSQGELHLHVQPKSSLATGRVVGVEALVRWQHPTLGNVPPDQFVPVAERSGFIRPLTLLVLEQSLQACASWRRAGQDVGVAVNLSARSLTDPALVRDVAEALERHDLPARLLTLEITEGSVMTDPARAMELLRTLRSMGVRLSVDDFGTGYASLSYLKRLPVHEVKIDRSFVTHMVTDPDDATIVRSIIDLARNLGLDVVAEGVEDEAAWQQLARLGCTYAQGYHLGRPMPVAQFLPWLTRPPAVG
ncbi:MAG: GGDEF domain-containing protein [Mycobacteriales bacterium]